MSDVSLRPATAADTQELARVAHASFHQAFAGIMSPVALAQRPLSFFVERFGVQWPHVVVAERGGRIVGFSMVRERHIDMLFVDPGAQARGVGRVLLAGCEAGGAITLECFRDNRQARDFYEKHGWKLTQTLRRAFCGEDYDFVLYAKSA